jgi:L-lactate dehydrogenase complex protein LldG
MSAREEVLAAVRAALAPTGGPGPSAPGARHDPTRDASGGGRPASDVVSGVPDDVGPAAGQEPSVDRAALLDLFEERVTDYRADVTRCAAADLGSVVVGVLAGVRSVVVPSGLDLDVPLALVDDGLTSAELDAIEAVVTGSAVGIAETGTVVLDHGQDQGRRAVTLLPDLHVCVVRESQVVPDVGDALALLDPLRPQTWVSGPSATSDIELSRVEGVHGPRRLHVVLVSAGDAS